MTEELGYRAVCQCCGQFLGPEHERAKERPAGGVQDMMEVMGMTQGSPRLSSPSYAALWDEQVKLNQTFVAAIQGMVKTQELLAAEIAKLNRR